MKKLRLIIHNVRSAHNVGSMLRTCDGLGVEKVYMTGYTPYPPVSNDKRLPHQRSAIASRINKTALGAESVVKFEHHTNIKAFVAQLQELGFKVVALEQTAKAKDITKFKTQDNIALIVGEERDGLPPDILELTDFQLQIPMLGQKESFNVAVAAAMALYHLRFLS